MTAVYLGTAFVVWAGMAAVGVYVFFGSYWYRWRLSKKD